MELVAILSTHNHWPLSEYMGMRVSGLYEWAGVFRDVLRRE